MHQPYGGSFLGVLLAAAFLQPPDGGATIQASGLSDPRGDASTWYTFAAEQFSRTDGATALYEATRRQARRRPSRAADGS